MTFSEQILAAIEHANEVPRGARGRILFQAFLALAMAEKGEPLTIADVTKICAHETECAFRIGIVK
jgi:hypothetical protein